MTMQTPLMPKEQTPITPMQMRNAAEVELGNLKRASRVVWDPKTDIDIINRAIDLTMANKKPIKQNVREVFRQKLNENNPILSTRPVRIGAAEEEGALGHRSPKRVQ